MEGNRMDTVPAARSKHGEYRQLTCLQQAVSALLAVSVAVELLQYSLYWVVTACAQVLRIRMRVYQPSAIIVPAGLRQLHHRPRCDLWIDPWSDSMCCGHSCIPAQEQHTEQMVQKVHTVPGFPAE